MIYEGILLIVGALLIWAAITDLKERIIPNWIPLGIIILFGVFLAIEAVSGVTEPVLPVLSSLIVGLVVSVVFIGLFALNMIGGGDVKLIGAVSFWAGAEYIMLFLFLMAMTGGVLALVYFMKHQNRIDPEVSPELIVNKVSGNAATMAIDEQKQSLKKTHIPYGLAISVGGLFVVTKLFVNF